MTSIKSPEAAFRPVYNECFCVPEGSMDSALPVCPLMTIDGSEVRLVDTVAHILCSSTHFPVVQSISYYDMNGKVSGCN